MLYNCATMILTVSVRLQKGRVLEAEQKFDGAKSCFEAALSINPYHVKSMTYLVRRLRIYLC